MRTEVTLYRGTRYERGPTVRVQDISVFDWWQPFGSPRPETAEECAVEIAVAQLNLGSDEASPLTTILVQARRINEHTTGQTAA